MQKPPGKPGKGPAWSLANAGTRELNWLVHAPLILSGPDKAHRAKVLAARVALGERESRGLPHT